MNQTGFEQFFSSSYPVIDKDAIFKEWQAIKSPYNINTRRLPLPVWARRGLTDNGEQAWATLNSELNQADETEPYCIYIHIPFCANKCAFCDCYSFRLANHRLEHFEAYVATLSQEMKLWSQTGPLARRPVSTVHLGGGTPTFLEKGAFRQLILSCRQYFNITSQTEWAIETTSSELDDDNFARLDELGFSRLHLGVQSLSDPIRQLLKRREPAETVLAKLSKAVSLKWVTSVDLIYGLPTQSLESLLNDIFSLANIGIAGFSLYELQRSPHNRQFIKRYGLANRDRTLDYFFLQGASQVLAALGYRKNLFNHFALDQDKNLYFTFPERGEDCLAMGTIADGVFDDYHYRHPEYAAYCKGVGNTFPGLSGGVRHTVRESYLAPLEVALLSGKLTPALFVQILGEKCTEELLRYWSESSLVAPDRESAGQLCLTANGSWFVGEMMAQLSDSFSL